MHVGPKMAINPKKDPSPGGNRIPALSEPRCSGSPFSSVCPVGEARPVSI